MKQHLYEQFSRKGLAISLASQFITGDSIFLDLNGDVAGG